MDTSQYLDIFIDETREHLQNLNEHLLVLEKEPDNTDTINEIFRAAHSLKGMAGTMGFKRMQRLTHDMENLFQEVRNGNINVSSVLVDILFRGLDALENYLKNVIDTSDEGTEDNEDIINGLNEVLNGGAYNSDASTEKDEPQAAEKTHNTDKCKYRSIDLGDSEESVLNKVKEENKNLFGITVYLSETCVLKSARAFLVFRALEEVGEILKSVPAVEEIEDEEFELDFSMIYVTDETQEKINERILNVSEVSDVLIEPYSHYKKVEVKEALADKANDEVKTEKKETEESKEKAPAKQAKSGGKHTGRSVRVDIEKLDTLMNLVSELIIAKNGLVSYSGIESQAETVFKEQIEYLERVTTNLHESVMKVRMVPIESVVNRFPRMIRDLSKKLNRKMELYMSGEETELDRTVIDEIGDPLMHLLRNSADHGLEDNAARIAAGKPEVGSIFLDAYQDGNNVVIEVRDDGAGINVEKVKRKAVEKGHVTAEQAEKMSDKEAIDLLFKPSFSTAEQI